MEYTFLNKHTGAYAKDLKIPSEIYNSKKHDKLLTNKITLPFSSKNALKTEVNEYEVETVNLPEWMVEMQYMILGDYENFRRYKSFGLNLFTDYSESAFYKFTEAEREHFNEDMVKMCIALLNTKSTLNFYKSLKDKLLTWIYDGNRYNTPFSNKQWVILTKLWLQAQNKYEN